MPDIHKLHEKQPRRRRDWDFGWLVPVIRFVALNVVIFGLIFALDRAGVLGDDGRTCEVEDRFGQCLHWSDEP